MNTTPTTEVASDTKTFAEKVASTLAETKKDANGKLQFPKDTPEEVIYAATGEIRRRDTQAAFTKERQNNAALAAEKTELMKTLNSSVKLNLTEQVKEELEDLKLSDPEAWRNKVNALENEAKQKRNEEIDQKLKDVSAKGVETAEMERRTNVLNQFKIDNPGFEINDDIITNDIPPRITNKLKNNELSFEDFLNEAKTYLSKGKVIADGNKTLNQPNLSKAGGGDKPAKEAVKKQQADDYLTATW